MEAKNFFSIKTLIPFRLKYMYIDLPEYLADEIFVKDKLPVKYGNEYENKNEKYNFIFCTIWKKDREKFETCMKQLVNKMLILRHTDYIEFCNKFFEETKSLNKRDET